MTLRVLIPSTALLWGLQFAFLNPALALVLTTLYDASTTELGWALALYNASALIATTLIPAHADRTGRYLRPMLVSAVLTILLSALLALAASLPLAIAALVVLGGPAGVGSTMLFAHLRHSGADSTQIINTRALFSVAWVAGPPIATFLIGAFGERAALLAIALTAVGSFVATALLQSHGARAAPENTSDEEPDPGPLPGRAGVAIIVIGFVLLQAANASAMSFMTVYVTQSLGLDVVWAGIALGVAAGLEVPALFVLGRLSRRFSAQGLIITGCTLGVGYYVLLAMVETPVGLIGIQVLNAWCFATIAGTGLTLFQQIIVRPGLSTSLYMNARRVGAILSGGVIALGSMTAFGQAGIYLVCAALTAGGIVAIVMAHHRSPRTVVG
ncbi:MFS transporter [Brachybacterium sacelli]|uniref:SET family sugar efflux transporter-like MFS transporter n=1 Tax=Brachybacterium sacelli TaxID=173364 RepID=A0ABS4WZN5_9MICO|nr:SET family sugar efflux transporter-like MFS transporter [Brachybacterium sacelli]